MAATRSGVIRRLLGWVALLLMPVSVWAASWQILVVGLRDDPRYERKTLEQAFIGKPTGRPLVAAQIAIDELKDNLQDSGNQLKLQDLQWDGKSTTELLGEINKRKAQVLLLDLPVEQQKALMDAFAKISTAPIVFNISESSDALRGASCHPHWLHTLPSDRMLADAMAQWLAARNWRDMILLVGPEPQDQALRDIWTASIKRFGLKVKAERKFVLSGDPRQREASNPKLLTAEPAHDVVMVLDSVGEFAKGLPFNTALPRPVVGSSGLVPLAWHTSWERYGAPQLSHRFQKLTNKQMASQDWASWMAVKSFATALDEEPKATLAQLLNNLRSGKTTLDGFKGTALSFRPWDGQLRQGIFMAHGQAVAGMAPVEGVLHPKEILDTLGADEPESLCKRR
ncbi:MAG: branched-chain amino acid ABC transporter substrate-binding protein [Betaproteobacteria bacterium]|nr:branched-chain amino acid ABC transporter substrate-binding protein [Betaproteobacteria bacterium]